MLASTPFNKELRICSKTVEAPDDYKTKFEALEKFKQLMFLAKRGDAIAQYRLAKACPKNSASYLLWMNKAASQDLTNAMLDLSRAYAENGTDKGISQAASLVIKIFRSGDSFIISEAIDLINRNALLRREVARQAQGTSLAKSPLSFFAYEAPTAEIEPVDIHLAETPNI